MHQQVHMLSLLITHTTNCPIRTNRLNKLQNEMEAQDLLSLKQSLASCWLSLEKTVKGIRANWVSLVSELEEEENSRNCPTAKGIRKRIQTYAFPALTYLLSDVLAVVNCMNLPLQKENVNISHIKPVVNMTLATLEDLMNGPGKAETEFNKALQYGNFRGIKLTHVDAQKFSVL